MEASEILTPRKHLTLDTWHFQANTDCHLFVECPSLWLLQLSSTASSRGPALTASAAILCNSITACYPGPSKKASHWPPLWCTILVPLTLIFAPVHLHLGMYHLYSPHLVYTPHWVLSCGFTSKNEVTARGKTCSTSKPSQNVWWSKSSPLVHHGEQKVQTLKLSHIPNPMLGTPNLTPNQHGRSYPQSPQGPGSNHSTLRSNHTHSPCLWWGPQLERGTGAQTRNRCGASLSLRAEGSFKIFFPSSAPLVNAWPLPNCRDPCLKLKAHATCTADSIFPSWFSSAR